ncbi:MAG TPA: DNRLRE domain-containing protein, partial [Anaerolineales bacterium]
LGGSGSDYGTGLAFDGAGNILVTGQSEASWGAPLRRFTAGTDAFAARLSPAGARVWNTFLGGPGFDQAWGIAVDARRNAYLTGGSDGGWGSPIDPYAASRDMFVAKLGMAGSFRSAAAEDGWVLESAEGSNQGGTMNTAASGFNVGDDASDRQYRAVLSFDTAGLPDNAVITKVTVQVKRQGITGDNPFNTHGGLKVDIRAPYFGTSAALAPGDFQAAASRGSVGTFNKVPAAGGWYSAVLGQSAYAYINRKGTTQLRLRFSLDDNDDMSADYIRFYSGNAGSLSYRPVLTVEYYTP